MRENARILTVPLHKKWVEGGKEKVAPGSAGEEIIEGETDNNTGKK